MKINKYMLLPITLLLASVTLYKDNNVSANSRLSIHNDYKNNKDYIKSIGEYQSIKEKPVMKHIDFKVGKSNKELYPDQYADKKASIPQPEAQPATSQPVQVSQQQASSSTYVAPVQSIQQPVQQSNVNSQTEANKSSVASQPATSTGSTAKVTFYDPAVLGASTMPGGIYSGVAANLSVYPKGTVLKITLQDGQVLTRTVNDTGAFASSNPNQLDIAIPNSQVPSWGAGTAQVQVIG